MKPCAILACGPSLNDYPLHRLKIPTIGVNIAWMRHWPDLHVTFEQVHFQRHPGIYYELHRQGRLYTSGTWVVGKKLNLLPESEEWCTDLDRGVVLSKNGIGSVAYGALQLVKGLGFDPVYFLGLDLQGKKFDGSEATAERQIPLWQQAKEYAGEVYVVGPSKSPFGQVSFDQLLRL